jgi:hypothetical protein
MDGFEIAFERTRSDLVAAFGVRISRSTFARLNRQLELEEQLSNRDDIKAKASAVAHEEQNEDVRIASIALLKEKAFELATGNNRHDLRTASRLLQDVHRLEQCAVGSQPHREITEDYGLAIARNILLHFEELGAIHGNQTLSEERKQRMVMERILPEPSASVRLLHLPEANLQQPAEPLPGS